MKKLCVIILILTLSVSMCGMTWRDETESDTDYLSLMLISAAANTELSLRQGAIYENLRNEKIEENGLRYQATNFFTSIVSGDEIFLAIKEYQAKKYTDEELNLLAKIIWAEAGSNWLSDEWKMSVGEVVLNRVASPEFPNTIKEVIEQPGQYYGKNNSWFNSVKPSEKCIEIAKRLLNGERYINDPSVVFQANFPQGSGVAIEFKDSQLGSSYFCYSSHPEYYTEN